MNMQDLLGELLNQAGSGNLSASVSSVLSSLGSAEVGQLVTNSAQKMNVE